MITLAAVVAVVTLIIFVTRPREPVYEGKRLSEWLAVLYGNERDAAGNFLRLSPEVPQSRSSSEKGPEEKYRDAERAVREIGTEAIPQLIDLLRAEDWKVKLWLGKGVQSVPFITWRPQMAADLKRKGMLGCLALGPLAGPAIPDLQTIVEENIAESSLADWTLAKIGAPAVPSLIIALGHTNLTVRARTAGTLRAIGPTARDAIPKLMEHVSQNPPHEAGQAVWALGRINTNHETVIPALVGFLQRANGYQKIEACQAIGAFGTNAVAARPALMEAAESVDWRVRIAARTALEKVDIGTKQD